MRRRTMRTILAGALASSIAMAGMGGANAQVDELVGSVLGGTRALAVLSDGGADLNGGTVELGAGREEQFLVEVTDLNYDHVGYEVSAMLSNLYRRQGGAFDCDKHVEAGDVALAFPVAPSVANIGVVVEALLDVTGDLTAAAEGIASDIDPLGVIDTAVQTATGQTLAEFIASSGTIATGTVEQVAASVDDVLSGVTSGLPVRVHAGNARAFSRPTSHSQCGGGSANPTQILVMAGDAQAGLDGLLGTLTEELNAALAALGISQADLEAAVAGAVDNAEAELNSVLAGAGLPLVDISATAAQVQAVVTDLADQIVRTLDEILGQSGAYLSVPMLIADPESAPESGHYRGTMTITMLDV